MNTTPDFDKIGQLISMERSSTLRALATFRLCFVTLASYVCILQLLRIGFWSGTVDRALIFLGIMSGLGRYTDGIELVWRGLGPVGQLAAFIILPLMTVSSVFLLGNKLPFNVSFLILITFLVAMGYGLLRAVKDPLRMARFRQIQRYLRTLPKSERRINKKRMEMNFETLIAEGFH